MSNDHQPPDVKPDWHDEADAKVNGEGEGQADMRFVPVTNTEQPAVLCWHWARQGFVNARTAEANPIRDL